MIAKVISESIIFCSVGFSKCNVRYTWFILEIYQDDKYKWTSFFSGIIILSSGTVTELYTSKVCALCTSCWLKAMLLLLVVIEYDVVYFQRVFFMFVMIDWLGMDGFSYIFSIIIILLLYPSEKRWNKSILHVTLSATI